MTSRNFKSDTLKGGALRALPFLLTLLMLLFLLLPGPATGSVAAADSEEDEASLPEYSILLSDGGSTSDCPSVLVSGSTVTVTEAGSYTVTGSLSDGQLRVDTDKESKVRLVLSGVNITNSGSAAIYVLSADKLVLSLANGTSNTLATSGSFVQTDENNVDGVIFSKDDVTVKGSGSLSISALTGHGIVSKDDLKIKNGSITVTAARKTLSANGTVDIEGGNLTLTAGTEGIEASYVLINDGSVSIQAGDDGINATWIEDGVRPTVEINGGDITIVMAAGDTDGIDSNGDLIITGGTIDVTGNSSFDCDGNVTFTGGTVIVNGQQVTSIPNQMMGGRGGWGGGFGGFGGRQQQNAPGADGRQSFSGTDGTEEETYGGWPQGNDGFGGGGPGGGRRGGFGGHGV